MCKKPILLCVVLILCLASMLQAANIIWVSDNKNGTSTPSDKGFVDLLKAQGYNVDYQGQGGTGTPGYQFWRTLDNAKIATLNAADLIIVSRDLSSDAYANNATEVGQWSSLKKPLLLLIAHVARNDRWQWVETTGQNDVQPALQAVKTDHFIFNGVTLDATNRVNVFTGVGSISSATSAGNGTLIATRADNNQVWIAEWKTGQVFKSTTTQTAGGPRMLFAAGATGAGGPDGTLNLTADGQKMFLNAVRYLLGDTAAPGSAAAPNPAPKATDVPQDATLSWSPGKFAATHDVYIGLSAADVNNAGRTNPLGVLASQAQSASSYAPAGLQFGQTYYWRVDEVNAPPSATIIKGGLWSFTVEPFGYPIKNVTATASSAQPGMGPENTINGSGLDKSDLHSTEPTQMWMSTGAQPNWIQFAFDKAYKLHELWVWNSNQIIETFVGFGAKGIKVEYSVDGSTWTELQGVPEFARATGVPAYAHNTTVNLGGVLAKYVKLTISSTWGGLAQGGLSEVRFSYIPVQAREPQPAAGATGVDVDVTLNWRPGREAASHQVSFGGNKDAVTNGTAPAVTVPNHSYTPASLQFGTTYYWKVDEIGAAATPGTQAGEVWSFSTKEYAVVDDFESYTDDEGNRIYETWIDGWTNNTGSVVGNLNAPFAERTIIHGGKQSMPLEYNNIKTPYYSEAERTFAPVQNWTVSGADTLVLYVRGRAVAFFEKSAGNYVMGGGGTDIWNTADQFRFAGKRLNGNGTLVAKIESLVNTDPWAKAGVMIRESLAPGSRYAIVLASPGNGVHFQARLMTDVAAVSDNTAPAASTPAQNALRTPVWVKLERTGNTFNGFYSTDGVKWTAMWSPQTINMTANPVYIGLAVTSHNANALTTAEFSNVSTTGNVTGAWEVAAIGVAQPSNAAGQLHVMVQDSAGKSKVIKHPDPAAATVASWQPWRIPLSDLTGVNLAAVKKLYIGVGDRTSPKADGAGLLHIDDIGFGRPLPAK
jgi:hypothetical protein